MANKPLAAEGYTSYRYAGPYGGIAIGARDTADALNEVRRSLCSGEQPSIRLLQMWDGETWVAAEQASA